MFELLFLIALLYIFVLHLSDKFYHKSTKLYYDILMKLISEDKKFGEWLRTDYEKRGLNK